MNEYIENLANEYRKSMLVPRSHITPFDVESAGENGFIAGYEQAIKDGNKRTDNSVKFLSYKIAKDYVANYDGQFINDDSLTNYLEVNWEMYKDDILELDESVKDLHKELVNRMDRMQKLDDYHRGSTGFKYMFYDDELRPRE